MDGVRIRYTNKQSVFWYGGVPRKYAEAKAREHVSIFRREMVGEKLQNSSFLPGEIVKVDHSGIVVEFVTDYATDKEKAETVPFTPGA